MGEQSGAGTQRSDFRATTRRRRRSLSEDTEESREGSKSPRAESGVGIESQGSRGISGGVGTSRSVHGGPPVRKRRKITGRAMRVDPEPSTAHGTRLSSNGTAQPTKHVNGHSDSHHGPSPPTNGTSSAAQNGVSTSITRNKSPTFFGHNREEVTRLLIQGLTDLGYQGAADRLSQESGYEVESPSVAAFRHAVLQGEWFEAESLLFGSSSTDDGGGVSISHDDLHPHAGLDFADGVDVDGLKFQMREQKYLELLEARDLGNALMVLRQELTPLNQDTAKLHHLSRYVWSAQCDGSEFPP